MKRRLNFNFPEEIRDILSKQQASGLSVARYCEKECLAVSTFFPQLSAADLASWAKTLAAKGMPANYSEMKKNGTLSSSLTAAVSSPSPDRIRLMIIMVPWQQPFSKLQLLCTADCSGRNQFTYRIKYRN
jgi:hypothetical protein